MNKNIYKELKNFDGILIDKYVSEIIEKYAQFRGKHLRKIFLQEFGIPLGCHVGYGVLSRVSMPSCGDCYAIFDYYFNGKRFAREFQRNSGNWTSDLYIVKTYPEEFIPTKIDNYETTGRKSIYDQ